MTPIDADCVSAVRLSGQSVLIEFSRDLRDTRQVVAIVRVPLAEYNLRLALLMGIAQW